MKRRFILFIVLVSVTFFLMGCALVYHRTYYSESEKETIFGLLEIPDEDTPLIPLWHRVAEWDEDDDADRKDCEGCRHKEERPCSGQGEKMRLGHHVEDTPCPHHREGHHEKSKNSHEGTHEHEKN